MELECLRCQFFCCRGHFLGGPGVLLDHLVQLLDRRVDLVRSQGLLPGGRADLPHQVRDLLDVRHELRQHQTRFFGNVNAGSRQLVDLRRRRPGPPREFADLGRHHREPLAVLARVGRLDRGVERQKVRLARDLFDDRYLAGDLLHRVHGPG